MNTKELKDKCRKLRRDILRMIGSAGSGHPGGSLSAVELMAGVYYTQMRIDQRIRVQRTVTVLFLVRGMEHPAIMLY